MTNPPRFDPYGLFEALEGNRVSFVVVGGFARVVHGSAETSDGLDIVPSLREENLRRLSRALKELDATDARRRALAALKLDEGSILTARTRAGELRVVAAPWGTRGYDDLRIRAVRENLGRRARPQIASLVDCVRMLEASERRVDAERLLRLRRLMNLERQVTRQLGRGIER